MPDIIGSIASDPLPAQNLDDQAIMSLETLNDLRLRIVEEDYDPPAEEMAAAVQSIRPERAKDSAPKTPKAKKESVKKKAENLNLDDLM